MIGEKNSLNYSGEEMLDDSSIIDYKKKIINISAVDNDKLIDIFNVNGNGYNKIKLISNVSGLSINNFLNINYKLLFGNFGGRL